MKKPRTKTALLILILLMTTKQIFGLILLSSALAYYNYENNNAPNTTVVVLPNNKPEVIPDQTPKPKPEIKNSLFLTDVDKHRNIEENTVYGDVLSHSFDEPYGDRYGRRINVHETSHGITSELRNFYQKALKKKLNVFYILNGKCIVLEESNINMRLVTKYIPEDLRSYRYNLYFVKGIVDWNDMPSYIIDEWNSYILASKSAVEDFNNGLIQEKVDAVSGCLDFSIYSVCFAMAVKNHDPEYWDSYPQFKNIIKYLLIEAEKTFGEGMKIENFRNSAQKTLFENLQKNKEAAEIRDFLTKEFDGIFLLKNQ
jgi:hypothetical protein